MGIDARKLGSKLGSAALNMGTAVNPVAGLVLKTAAPMLKKAVANHMNNAAPGADKVETAPAAAAPEGGSKKRKRTQKRKIKRTQKRKIKSKSNKRKLKRTNKRKSRK